jgi:hypothetical protein
MKGKLKSIKIMKKRKKREFNYEMIWQIWRKGKFQCEIIWKIWKKGKFNSEMIWNIWKKSKLNSEKIMKIWKKDKLNSQMIWKIWKKSKLNSENIWKIQKKCKLNSENMEDFDVSYNYTQRDLLLLSFPPFHPLLSALLLLPFRHPPFHPPSRHPPPLPSMHVYTLFFRIEKNHHGIGFLLETMQVGI